jgi:diguanylate cyclase
MLSRLRPRRREEIPDGSTAADLGTEVISYLHKHGIPSAPRYYALVHTAMSDLTSVAAHAISEATLDGTAMNREKADAILAAMNGAPGDAEEHERLRHQTLHLADLAADAAAATNQFGRDLSEGLGDLDKDVRSVTAVLSSMFERTRATEARLAAAVAEIEHLRDEVAEARNDAMRDELTGLLNRRGIIEHIAGLDPHHPRTIAVCDIDTFKAINDGHGHEVGDRVLKVVAATLAEGCAPHLVARWGGEEFIVVLDESDPARAAEIIDTVREQLGYRALRVRETGESLGRVTFSAGVAAFNPPPFESALRLADGLLYQAKLAGRNRVLADAPSAKAA